MSAWIPSWGEGDDQIAAFMHELSDERAVRLAGAMLGLIWSRGIVQDRFRWVFPVLCVEFTVEAHSLVRPMKLGFYSEWPGSDSPAPDEG